jgi:bacterioferritin-associated ferredoxin
MVLKMYICLCHGVNEATIRKAVKNGSRTLRELSFQTGCGTQCGSCVSQVQSLLLETLRSEQAATNTPFLHIVATA